jgi:hypothetical protein
MCQCKHYLFTTKKHVPVRNKYNMKCPMIFHIAYNNSTYFLFFITLSTFCI